MKRINFSELGKTRRNRDQSDVHEVVDIITGSQNPFNKETVLGHQNGLTSSLVKWHHQK